MTDELDELRDRLESDGEVVSVDPSVLLPIHRRCQDVKTGNADPLSPNVRRAGRVFGDFIHRSDPSNGVYEYTSGQARECLEGARDPLTAPSKTIKRVFDKIEELSIPEDGSEPLLAREKDQGRHVLRASGKAWRSYCREIQSLVEDGQRPDDATAAPAVVEGDGESTARADGGATGTDAESSDNVVRTSNGSVSDRVDPG